MMYMHDIMCKQLATSGQITWADIEQSAKAGLPPCSSYIWGFSAFAKHHSGGATGELLKTLNKSSKVWRPWASFIIMHHHGHAIHVC
eukprot:7851709-Karenia_brevis.AAC.1